jgi:hypothetical protein
MNQSNQETNTHLLLQVCVVGDVAEDLHIRGADLLVLAGSTQTDLRSDPILEPIEQSALEKMGIEWGRCLRGNEHGGDAEELQLLAVEGVCREESVDV